MPSPAASSAPLGRRTVVLAAAALGGSAALTACGLVDRVPAPRPREADADEPLVRGARADQERVLAAVTAVVAAQPTLAATLGRLVEHHRVHVQVLGGNADDTASPSPSPSVTPTAAPTPAAALAQVRALEAAASQARRRDAGRAASGDLARVLAAMAAGQAQHVVVVDQAAGALR